MPLSRSHRRGRSKIGVDLRAWQPPRYPARTTEALEPPSGASCFARLEGFPRNAAVGQGNRACPLNAHPAAWKWNRRGFLGRSPAWPTWDPSRRRSGVSGPFARRHRGCQGKIGPRQRPRTSGGSPSFVPSGTNVPSATPLPLRKPLSALSGVFRARLVIQFTTIRYIPYISSGPRR